ANIFSSKSIAQFRFRGSFWDRKYCGNGGFGTLPKVLKPPNRLELNSIRSLRNRRLNVFEASVDVVNGGCNIINLCNNNNKTILCL
ncbi:hypothetical protein Ddye_007287, partial [Dipteronia dyeriana]